MAPRFIRTLLLVSTLSLVIVPMRGASAQSDELVGTIQAGEALSCTVNPEISPIEHQRCHGGSFNGLVLDMAMTRPDSSLVCHGAPGRSIDFRTRETLVSGRGFLSPTTVHVQGAPPNQAFRCKFVITGTFHREGTVAIGRLRLNVTRELNGVGTFFHHYCTRFVATAVPTVVGGTLVMAEVEGRACEPRPREDPEDVATHGRSPEDDTRHG